MAKPKPVRLATPEPNNARRKTTKITSLRTPVRAYVVGPTFFMKRIETRFKHTTNKPLAHKASRKSQISENVTCGKSIMSIGIVKSMQTVELEAQHALKGSRFTEYLVDMRAFVKHNRQASAIVLLICSKNPSILKY